MPRELDEREDQGFSLNGRWVNSHELRCGDVLVGQDGQQRTVLKIEQEYVSGFAVHNLTICENHTFAVGPDAVLVHNTGECLEAAVERGMRILQGPTAPDEMVGVLEKLGRPMSRTKIGEVIHDVKRKMNIGATEDLIFDRSGGLWDSRTGEFIGKIWEAF